MPSPKPPGASEDWKVARSGASANGIADRGGSMIKRRRIAVLGAFAVAASVFLLPASPAQAVTFDNACVNSLIPTQASLIPVTMTADASPNPVSPGGVITVRFGCDPGEVVESAPPSTIVRTDPAATFASTQIQQPASNISINDVS